MNAPGRAILCLGPFDIDNAMASAPPLLVGAPPLTALLGIAHLAARLLHTETSVPAFPQAYAIALIARGKCRFLGLSGHSHKPNAKRYPYGDARIDLRVAFLLAYGDRTGPNLPTTWNVPTTEMVNILSLAGQRLHSFLHRPLLRGLAKPPLPSLACAASILQDHSEIKNNLHRLRLVCAPVLLPPEERLESTDSQQIFLPQRIYDGYVFPTVVGYQAVSFLAKNVRRSIRSDYSREVAVAEPIFAPIALRSIQDAFQNADARFWWRPAHREPNQYLWEICT